MVLNRNIMYGTDALGVMQSASDPRRNIFQGGLLPNTWIREIRDDLDYLKYQVDKLKETSAVESNIKQASAAQKADTEIQRNLRQAAILNRSSDKEILDTMLSYLDGSISIEAIPYAAYESQAAAREQQQQNRNVKQAGLNAKPEDMLQTFMDFGDGIS